MATPSIRGHNGTLTIFDNGDPVNIFTITSADVNQDSTFQRSFFVGQRFPEGDQSIDGYSGTIEMETKGPEIDEFMEALENNNLAGIGISDYSFVLSEFYTDGRSKSYVYFDLQFRLSKRLPGSTQKITKTYEFQAAGRRAVEG